MLLTKKAPTHLVVPQPTGPYRFRDRLTGQEVELPAEDFDDPDGFVRGRPELDISDLESAGSQEPGTEDDNKPGDEGTPPPGDPQ